MHATRYYSMKANKHAMKETEWMRAIQKKATTNGTCCGEKLYYKIYATCICQ